MATRTVFHDENGNELECYLNDALQVYINVGPKNIDDDPYHSGYITLDKDDVGKLIEILQEAKRVMDAEDEEEIEFEQPIIDITGEI